MEIPPPDPVKLLASWMEWERGDVTPGRAMANLKTGGLRQLLETLGNGGAGADRGPGSEEAAPAGEVAGGHPETWAPVV